MARMPPPVADMFRIQIAAAMCFGLAVIMLARRRLSLSDSQKPAQKPAVPPNRNPRGRIRHAIRSSKNNRRVAPTRQIIPALNLGSDPGRVGS